MLAQAIQLRSKPKPNFHNPLYHLSFPAWHTFIDSLAHRRQWPLEAICWEHQQQTWRDSMISASSGFAIIATIATVNLDSRQGCLCKSQRCWMWKHGRNFVVKCGGTAWCQTNIVIGSMQEWRFIYTDSQSYF